MILNTKNESLYYILGKYIFIIISIILVIQSAFNYFTTKSQLTNEIKNDIEVSSRQLKNSVIPFIESYEVTEYEELIKYEMFHNNLLAIVIEDYLTGKIIGEKSFVTGIIRNENNQLENYDSISNDTLNNLKKTTLKKETVLINSENEEIGKLLIYGTDYFINKELNLIIIKNLVVSLLIYTIILFIFFLIVKKVLIKPIENIVNSLSFKKDDEMMFNKIKECSSKEFDFLSNSINLMTQQIQDAHKEIKESELKWQFAVEGNGDGLWDWNVKTNEVFFSSKWKEMLGFKEDEIKGSLEEWEKRVHPDDIKQVYIDIQNHLEGKTKVYINEHRVKCKNGLYKWILDRGIIVEKDNNNKPLRMIGTHSDIDERKMYEHKMKQALTVYENTNEGIMITNTNNQIVDVNTSFCKTTGYLREEIIGQNPSILKSNLNKEEFYSTMWESIQKNGYWQGEITNKKKNNQLYDEYLSINTIRDKKGNITNYIGIFSDISVLKQQEKLILQQSRTSAIGEMIGNIAHQWRQPLSAITTISTGLKLQLEMGIPLSSDENIENLNKINEQAQYLSRTIEDFRGFFSTKLTEVVDFEVSEAIEKVNDLTKDSFRNNFIEVNYDMDKEIYIKSNKNLLIQALLNIYNNALDALKEREKDRLFFISAKKEDNNIVIKIKDNAGGIPLDYIEKIFDPYFTTKHQSQGTGIGLYMTHQIIVKQIKGTISVNNISYTYNNENHLGAEFTIKINSL
jgi:PAS domain S-box-containing protein